MEQVSERDFSDPDGFLKSSISPSETPKWEEAGLVVRAARLDALSLPDSARTFLGPEHANGDVRGSISDR